MMFICQFRLVISGSHTFSLSLEGKVFNILKTSTFIGKQPISDFCLKETMSCLWTPKKQVWEDTMTLVKGRS
jgi:hypothetical protein